MDLEMVVCQEESRELRAAGKVLDLLDEVLRKVKGVQVHQGVQAPEMVDEGGPSFEWSCYSERVLFAVVVLT